jgi:hypothetical protein
MLYCEINNAAVPRASHSLLINAYSLFKAENYFKQLSTKYDKYATAPYPSPSRLSVHALVMVQPVFVSAILCSNASGKAVGGQRRIQTVYPLNSKENSKPSATLDDVCCAWR